MTADANRSGHVSIALIGLRGSGKSTVGAILARLMDIQFVDTDEIIISQAGRSIAAIFAEEGEAGFRRRECDAVSEVAANPPGVISVGGGAIVNESNVQRLQGVATIVWLTAPVDVLWARISADQRTDDTRPGLTDRSGADELRRLLTQREPLYARAADLIVDTTGLEPPSVARRIMMDLALEAP